MLLLKEKNNMNIKNISAFTLIELIVVTTIIILISSSWVFYFLDFVKWKDIDWKIYNIESVLVELDKKVKNYSIFDYEIQLNTWTGQYWYISYINNFDLPFNQKVNFNSITWSWIILTNWSINEMWKLKLYKQEKLFLFKEITWNQNINFDFNEEPFYKIIWTMSWEILNEIDINYFSEENLSPKKNNLLILTNINSKQDKTWSENINNLIITNIWWNKRFYNNNKTNELNINEIYLFFENNWTEKFIKITK